MKKFLFIAFFILGLNFSFAHIDRPIDALIFEGKTYDAYTPILAPFVGTDRKLQRALSANPVNPRLPKHYYATYEIKDSKLYLNKVEIIQISDNLMRKWRFPLALTYKLEPVDAEKLFGKGATFPILCDWYSGTVYSTIYDGNNYYPLLFDENYSFKIKAGEFLEMKKFSTRNLLASSVSMSEASLIYKFFTDDSFGKENMRFDLRCVADLNFMKLDEFSLISRGQAFKTRGYFTLDRKKTPYLYLPKTAKTPALRFSLVNKSAQDISDFKNGDRVEATVTMSPYDKRKVALLALKHLEDDDLIHSPDFVFRIRDGK